MVISVFKKTFYYLFHQLHYKGNATGANQVTYHGIGRCGQGLYWNQQYDIDASDDVGNSQLAFAQSLYGHEEYKPSSHGDEVLDHGETRDAKDTS